jgi:hypothetical protein
VSLNSKQLARAASVFLLLGLSACQHYPIIGQRRGVTGQSAWQGFGEHGDNTVEVRVGGDVEHPGTYYFPRGSNIAKACTVAGAFEAGYGHREPMAVLIRQDGRKFSYDPRQKLSFRRGAAKVELREGDTLYVLRFVSMYP